MDRGSETLLREVFVSLRIQGSAHTNNLSVSVSDLPVDTRRLLLIHESSHFTFIVKVRFGAFYFLSLVR